MYTLWVIRVTPFRETYHFSFFKPFGDTPLVTPFCESLLFTLCFWMVYYSKRYALCKNISYEKFSCLLFLNEDLLLAFAIWGGQTAYSCVCAPTHKLYLGTAMPFSYPTLQRFAVQCCQIGSHCGDMSCQNARARTRLRCSLR